MNKQIIKVPKGIQFISEWEDYEIPKGKHCIVDKGVTGCGYTEYCLTNDENMVIVSPRTLLLENKSAQHRKDRNIYYAKNTITNIESRNEYESRIYNHIVFCQDNNMACKILVTYDSLHYISDLLERLGMIDDFIKVVDEFQSIFLDSFFKAEVELSLVETLQKSKSVIYLSATPMLDKYLERLEEFKDLDFYKLDWSETGYVETIHIQRKKVKSLFAECGGIIVDYLNGNFPVTVNNKKEVVQSKEAVFYFNSVSDIVRLLSKYDLTSSNTRVICSDTKENRKKLKRLNFKPEKVPLKGERNPMFMFCTSTSYIGVDFYSDNAKSYIFADPSISSLALDISLDLPQIIGRQRDKSNPFKNDVILFYKIATYKKDAITRENFDNAQRLRRESTEVLLTEFSKMTARGQVEYLKKIRDGIQVSQYKGDFVSISRNSNYPVYNPLIDLANERAWEVSQEEYQNSLTVTKSILDQGYLVKEKTLDKLVNNFMETQFNNLGGFDKKLQSLCEFLDLNGKLPEVYELLRSRLPNSKYLSFYNYYGTKGCSSKKYREKELTLGLKSALCQDTLREIIYKTFLIGRSYLKSEIKKLLGEIYLNLGITDKTPKATDLKDYFELSRTKITLPDKRVMDGVKLNKKKE